MKKHLKKMYENKFIVIEGLDCSGKSTQVKKLSDFFSENKIKHIVTKEPGGTEFGEALRSIILSDASEKLNPMTRLLSFLAIRAEHYAKVLIPKMEEGYTIICDRFDLSTYAYLFNRIERDVILSIDEASIGHLCKELGAMKFTDCAKFIFLDIPSTEFKNRYQKRKQASLNYYDKYVFQNFTFMRKAYQELAPILGYETINANGDEGLVTKRILSCIKQEGKK